MGAPNAGTPAPAPLEANLELPFSFNHYDPPDFAAAPGLAVKACGDTSCASLLDSSTTNSAGHVRLAVPAGADGFLGYLSVTDADGLSREDARAYESTLLTKALRRYADVEIPMSCRLVRLRGRLFPVLKISGITETIALAASQHQEAGLFEGRIYIRTEDAETTELRDAALLRRMIDGLVGQRLRRLITSA